MIVVFDREGSLFTALRALDLGVPLWRVRDASRLEHPDQVELAVVPSLADIPADLGRSGRALDVIVVTSRYDPDDALRAFSHGLLGYVDATAERDAVRAAILGCLRGESAFPRAIVGRWLRRTNVCVRAHCSAARLTRRQRDVLRFVGQGFADKEIAERLGIATATAQKHVTNILDRLGVANRAAAAAAVCALVLGPTGSATTDRQQGCIAAA